MLIPVAKMQLLTTAACNYSIFSKRFPVSFPQYCKSYSLYHNPVNQTFCTILMRCSTSPWFMLFWTLPVTEKKGYTWWQVKSLTFNKPQSTHGNSRQQSSHIDSIAETHPLLVKGRILLSWHTSPFSQYITALLYFSVQTLCPVKFSV